MKGKLKKLSSVNDKEKHPRICLEKNVTSTRTKGFESFYLINNPTPEINFQEIDISCKLLGEKISAPFIIMPMTAGSKISGQINRNLAGAANDIGIAMAVGS